MQDYTDLASKNGVTLLAHGKCSQYGHSLRQPEYEVKADKFA